MADLSGASQVMDHDTILVVTIIIVSVVVLALLALVMLVSEDRDRLQRAVWELEEQINRIESGEEER